MEMAILRQSALSINAKPKAGTMNLGASGDEADKPAPGIKPAEKEKIFF